MVATWTDTAARLKGYSEFHLENGSSARKKARGGEGMVLNNVDWGSIADWVSGVGSVSASLIALYLSGSERRAKRAASRPVLTCDIKSSPETEWIELQLLIENDSMKAWRTSSVEILRPRGARVVDRDKAMVRDSYGNAALDPLAREQNAGQKVEIKINVSSVGSSGASWQTSGVHGNRVYRWILIKRSTPTAGSLKLRIHFASLEPVPDRFAVTIIRDLPAQEIV